MSQRIRAAEDSVYHRVTVTPETSTTPPTPGNHITTEGGDRLVTEGGDALVTE